MKSILFLVCFVVSTESSWNSPHFPEDVIKLSWCSFHVFICTVCVLDVWPAYIQLHFHIYDTYSCKESERQVWIITVFDQLLWSASMRPELSLVCCSWSHCINASRSANRGLKLHYFCWIFLWVLQLCWQLFVLGLENLISTLPWWYLQQRPSSTWLWRSTSFFFFIKVQIIYQSFCSFFWVDAGKPQSKS